MKKLGLIMFVMLFGVFGANAQETAKVKTIQVQTSAICGECKERIEDKLNYTKGIIYAELDLKTKIVEVKYKTKFLTATQIRLIIVSLGYNADNAKRNTEAYNKLPSCCKSGGSCDQIEEY